MSDCQTRATTGGPKMRWETIPLGTGQAHTSRCWARLNKKLEWSGGLPVLDMWTLSSATISWREQTPRFVALTFLPWLLSARECEWITWTSHWKARCGILVFCYTLYLISYFILLSMDIYMASISIYCTLMSSACFRYWWAPHVVDFYVTIFTSQVFSTKPCYNSGILMISVCSC